MIPPFLIAIFIVDNIEPFNNIFTFFIVFYLLSFLFFHQTSIKNFFLGKDETRRGGR